PDKAVTEIFRVCKKGGRVVGSVPSTSHIWRWRRRLSMTCGGGEPFHRNFTWNEISDLWRQAGFRVCIQQSCLGLNWMFILEKP
ncbi:MAG: hypothetical protein Q7R34_09385, partial [Dehalococcoidia bacterium]|nr:hypothetical protein [Dehalococcoidia bacterium]